MLNQISRVYSKFCDIPVQCSDGVTHCQAITLSLISPLISSCLEEDSLLHLPDNSCQEVEHLFTQLWDKDCRDQIIPDHFLSTYHWADFRNNRYTTKSNHRTTQQIQIHNHHISDPLQKTQNFEEKFSQFLKQLSLEGYNKVEANKTFEIIAKHLSSSLTVQILEDEENSSPNIQMVKKVQTIPMEVESYHQHCPPDKIDEKSEPTNQSSTSCQCSHCGKVLSDRKSLRIHEQVIHLNIRKYSCDQCGKDFGQKADMNDHIQQIHKKENKFVCDLCGEILCSRQTLSTHRLVHKDETKNIECHLCSSVFRHKSTFRKHVQRVHEFDQSKMLQCENCKKLFKHMEGLKRHKKKMHSSYSSVRYGCEICSKDYSFQYDLNKHVKNVHNKKISNERLSFDIFDSRNSTRVIVEPINSQGQLENILIDTHCTIDNNHVTLLSPNINTILGN